MFKNKRRQSGKEDLTPEQDQQLREVVSDKGSALILMGFCLGSAISPIIGGYFEDKWDL